MPDDPTWPSPHDPVDDTPEASWPTSGTTPPPPPAPTPPPPPPPAPTDPPAGMVRLNGELVDLDGGAAGPPPPSWPPASPPPAFSVPPASSGGKRTLLAVLAGVVVLVVGAVAVVAVAFVRVGETATSSADATSVVTGPGTATAPAPAPAAGPELSIDVAAAEAAISKASFVGVAAGVPLPADVHAQFLRTVEALAAGTDAQAVEPPNDVRLSGDLLYDRITVEVDQYWDHPYTDMVIAIRRVAGTGSFCVSIGDCSDITAALATLESLTADVLEPEAPILGPSFEELVAGGWDDADDVDTYVAFAEGLGVEHDPAFIQLLRDIRSPDGYAQLPQAASFGPNPLRDLTDEALDAFEARGSAANSAHGSLVFQLLLAHTRAVSEATYCKADGISFEGCRPLLDQRAYVSYFTDLVGRA